MKLEGGSECVPLLNDEVVLCPPEFAMPLPIRQLILFHRHVVRKAPYQEEGEQRQQRRDEKGGDGETEKDNA